jgi:hypothetical protein
LHRAYHFAQEMIVPQLVKRRKVFGLNAISDALRGKLMNRGVKIDCH